MDSRYVSPIKLHDVLIRKGWDYVGAAFDTGSGIMVVRNNGDEVKN